MKVLVYDSETTGLVKFDLPSDDPSQPRITQLCAELVDDETEEVLASMNFIIKPNGWTIPEELEKLTGITNKKAEMIGVNMALVLPSFLALWRVADVRVAHNESFDMRMVRIELFRDTRYGEATADGWKSGPAFCTQAKSQRICNLPPTERMIASGRRGPKPPNLGEAYKHFTGQDLVNAHNAAVDVMACKAVYFALINLQRMAA